jgi:GGDEF domain-containing protein
MLRAIANHIRNDIRLVDELGRVGETTFAMVLPQTGGEGAAIAAERVRGGVRDLLGARDESVCTDVLAAPEDIEGLNDLQSSFETAQGDPVEEYEPASAA